MFIELIELLRCPRPHEESWLVAAFDRTDGRVILEGRLGCPVCGEDYRIVNGVAELGSPEVRPTATREYDPWRVAALLDLRAADAVAVLMGGACGAAPALLELLPVHVVALNPAVEIEPRERLGIVRCAGLVPLRSGIAAGFALDDANVELLEEAARALRESGRLLAPATAPVPEGFREIARDAAEYAATKEPAPARLQLRRG